MVIRRTAENENSLAHKALLKKTAQEQGVGPTISAKELLDINSRVFLSEGRSRPVICHGEAGEITHGPHDSLSFTPSNGMYTVSVAYHEQVTLVCEHCKKTKPIFQDGQCYDCKTNSIDQGERATLPPAEG